MKEQRREDCCRSRRTSIVDDRNCGRKIMTYLSTNSNEQEKRRKEDHKRISLKMNQQKYLDD